MPSTRSADRAQLAAFIHALFRYADEGTYVSWRAFRDDTKDAPPVFIASTAVTSTDAIATLVDDAELRATFTAQYEFPAVFCPPIATFSSATRAREVDLANGLALSVECDTNPAHARDTLEAILGPATVVVSSGGVTAAGEPKLHLHWRLAEPTDDADAHARLKRARILATAIVGGDATNVPAVHPIRWPGSWHRKGEPRLATIVALIADREVNLSSAVEQLELAAPYIERVTSSGSPIAAGDVAKMSALAAQLMRGEAIHAPLVALAYRFLKAGMADGQCVELLRGLMDAIPESSRGGEDRWSGHYRDISRTVRTAREKLDLEAPAAKADISGFVTGLQTPAIIVSRKREDPKEIPDYLLTPPGVLGDIARYGIESSVRPVPIFAVQAALALGSVVCARRYVTSQRNYSSLYFLNVAKSGTGKEEAKTTIERILNAAGARRLMGGSSYSSANAVFSALLAKPQHITIIDEFGRYLESSLGLGGGFKSETLTQLIEVFGRVHADMMTPQFSTMTLSPRAKADHEPRIIARPAITLLAMTTPSTFYESLRSARITDGFLNRFLVVEHDADRSPMGEWKNVDVPATIVDWVKQILAPHGNIDLGGQIDTVGDPMIVPLSEKAKAASFGFERDMLALSKFLEIGPDALGDMPIRASEIALRLGLICALADTPDTPIVTQDCMEWAIAYVRFFLNQTIAALRDRVADTPTRRMRNRILLAIRAQGPRGLTQRELYRTKEFIDVPHRDRMDAIESLVAAELIAWVDLPSQGPGRPRRAVVALEEANNAEFRDLNSRNSDESQPSGPQRVSDG